ncbi:MAG: hypothetical protein GXP22_07880 [Gammaproteobacteria bacterium]|nr:hypothetical protein [Gammaproteobacteria bacterium]
MNSDAINATMKTMRKLITLLLLASTLFANLSWAADTDAEIYFGHASSQWSQDPSSSPDSHSNSDSCDHCCHSLSHLTGLIEQSHISYSPSGYSYLALLTPYYRTHTQSPPTPPPNA